VTSNRPYLIRAVYEWLVDNGLTPYLQVNAEAEGVVVPAQFIKDGGILLNIGPAAVRDLQLRNDLIFFNARFAGVAMDVLVPPAAVLGIYARENGAGMLFPDEEPGPDEPGGATSAPQGERRPKLKVVK